MKVVVVGATGLIGKAVATLLTDKGHEVVQVSRNTKPGVDITDLESIDRFYAAIGEVDAVISASFRSTSVVPVSEMSDEGFSQDVKAKLLGQVNLVRHGLSKVRPGGVFILTGGIVPPWPKTSMLALIEGGLEGFVQAAARDFQDAHRIVIVHPPVVREWAIKVGLDGSWPNAATVAEAYLKALEGKTTGQPVFVEGYSPA